MPAGIPVQTITAQSLQGKTVSMHCSLDAVFLFMCSVFGHSAMQLPARVKEFGSILSSLCPSATFLPFISFQDVRLKRDRFKKELSCMRQVFGFTVNSF